MSDAVRDRRVELRGHCRLIEVRGSHDRHITETQLPHLALEQPAKAALLDRPDSRGVVIEDEAVSRADGVYEILRRSPAVDPFPTLPLIWDRKTCESLDLLLGELQHMWLDLQHVEDVLGDGTLPQTRIAVDHQRNARHLSLLFAIVQPANPDRERHCIRVREPCHPISFDSHRLWLIDSQLLIGPPRALCAILP